MVAAMQKYGEKNVALDSIAQAGFNSVMNMQSSLDGVKDLNTDAILKAFKGSTEQPNFMAHPFLCNGKQVPGASSVCNAFQKMKQVKGGKVTPSTTSGSAGRRYTGRPRRRPCPPTPSSCSWAWARVPSTASSPWAWCSSTAAPAWSTSATARSMFIAYVYLGLREEGTLQFPWVVIPHEIDFGTPLGAAPAIALSLVYAGVLGIVMYWLIYRPLRSASALSRVCASVGVMLALQAIAVLNYGTTAKSTEAILPTEPLQIGNVTVPSDRLWFAGIVVVIAAVLALVYRYTRFGLATQASAENEEGAALVGLSADRSAAATGSSRRSWRASPASSSRRSRPSTRPRTRCSSCRRWASCWSRAGRVAAGRAPRSACCSRRSPSC